MHSSSTVILSGILSLIGAFGGSYVGGHLQAELWKREAFYKLAMESWNKRIETYRAMSGVLSEAQRIVIYRADTKEGPKLVDLLYCVTSTNKQQSCKVDPADAAAASLVRDIFEMQSRFETARAAASVYFCERTKAALKEIPAGPWWWNADEETRKNLLQSMEAEITCDLALVKVLR